ncbi:MAG: Methyltransferase type 11 [Parcubacteria group bacterium GW2011_GWA1_36_12]|nr:MAG: Methyltransferase type 11 [Parcubacteria group bacterium GW2011_GWA1_36_12]
MRSDLAKIVTFHFDALASDYDRKSLNRKKYNTAVDKLIIKYLMRQKKPLVLDVGCGTGSRAENLKSKIGGSKFYCVDSSLEMIKIAKKKKLDYVAKADMEKLPFQADYFDDILCLFNSFGYLNTYEKRLRTLYKFNKALKSEGLLIIDVMNSWHLGEGREYKRSLMRAFWDNFVTPNVLGFAVGDRYFELMIGNKVIPGFVHGFSVGEITGLLKNSGFEIIQSYIIGYDTGQIKKETRDGQLLFICRKIFNLTNEN